MSHGGLFRYLQFSFDRWRSGSPMSLASEVDTLSPAETPGVERHHAAFLKEARAAKSTWMTSPDAIALSFAIGLLESLE